MTTDGNGNQNKAQWLAASGHVSASSQSFRFILSLRMNSSFITTRPGVDPGFLGMRVHMYKDVGVLFADFVSFC